MGKGEWGERRGVDGFVAWLVAWTAVCLKISTNEYDIVGHDERLSAQRNEARWAPSITPLHYHLR